MWRYGELGRYGVVVLLVGLMVLPEINILKESPTI